jgi:hypothetical protein
MRARFIHVWRFPYMERIQWILDGVRRGNVGPLGPLELVAAWPVAVDIFCRESVAAEALRTWRK